MKKNEPKKKGKNKKFLSPAPLTKYVRIECDTSTYRDDSYWNVFGLSGNLINDVNNDCMCFKKAENCTTSFRLENVSIKLYTGSSHAYHIRILDAYTKNNGNFVHLVGNIIGLSWEM